MARIATIVLLVLDLDGLLNVIELKKRCSNSGEDIVPVYQTMMVMTGVNQCLPEIYTCGFVADSSHSSIYGFA